MKVTIIGAGIIGVTSAYFLAKSGHEVEVIDRQNGPALETSFANAGMLTPSMADPWNSPGILFTVLKNIGNSHSGFLLRLKAIPSLIGWGIRFLLNSSKDRFINNMHKSAALSCYSLKILEKIRDELNLDYEGLQTGSVKIFRDPKSMDEYAKLATHLAKHNMRHQILSPDEVVYIEPSLEPIKDELCGGIYFPDDEAGNAYKFTCEMAEHAEKLGVKFRYGVTVKDVVKNGTSIEKLITDHGDVISDRFVLCAGSFSYPLGKKLGLDIPVRPAKGYSISVPMDGWNRGPRMPIVDDGFHAAITPLGNVLRVAGTAELTGFDDALTAERIDNLYSFLDEIYHDLSLKTDKAKVKEWSGFRPMTADGAPLIGKTTIDNLFLNTGHGPLGWTMACGSAQMLSDIMSGKETALNVKDYNLNR